MAENRSTAKNLSASKGTKSTAGGAAPKTEQDKLADAYSEYTEAVTRIQEDAAKRYVELVGNYAEKLQKLQQDAIASDPSLAFATEVLRSYKAQDATGITDAYKMLSDNLEKNQATISKRYGGLVEGYNNELKELYEESRQRFDSCGKDNLSSVTEMTKNIDLTAMDRASMAILGYSLMLNAALVPEGAAGTGS